MSTPLRPLSTGELLDRTFHLYRNNFILFAGIAALAALTFVAALVILWALGFTFPTPGTDPRVFMREFSLYFGTIVLFYVLGASLAMGATIHAVSRVHLERLGSIGEAYRKVLPRVGRIIVIVLAIIVRMIGMLLLTYLALIPVGIVLGLILRAAGPETVLGRIFLMIFAAGIVIVVYGLIIRVYLKYSLAIQACLLEDMHVNDSLKRSAFLAQGSLWRIFLIHLLMWMMVLGLSFVLHWPGRLIFSHTSMAALVYDFLATFVAYTIAFPIAGIAIALLYYDQRVRKEALDLQLMMEAVSGAPQASATVAPTA